MQVVGQSLNPRATNYYPDIRQGRFQEGFNEGKNINGPWLARAAVHEAKLHGVDWVKIYTTQDFAGTMHMWTPDATLVNSPSLTFEEVQAVVDEAHRLGLKVACHTYGGEGMASCINAGADAPNHLLELDQDGIKVLLQKKRYHQSGTRSHSARLHTRQRSRSLRGRSAAFWSVQTGQCSPGTCGRC
jgi:imidazolonepropionase-like amidohydrolase